VFGRLRRIEHWSNAAYHGTTLGHILAGSDERYDTVSSFFSEQFGHTFKLFGDLTEHDSTALEGDFADGAGVLRYFRGGQVVAALATGQEEETETALKEEIRAGAATFA
jgi:Reductase C-terminal